MKKIDRLLITSFIPPFFVAFFIALFVLIMQFLWTYIDDIIGKGASIGFIIEILFYASVSLFPTALPIAVLIASVMLMGNLAERYELSTMKSAGIPLLRIMAPLMLICIGISAFSFVCSNNLIPIANLKFKSRLYDIRKQKPTLSLDEKVFNDDFKGYVIHIGKKESDNKSISDVLIYDHKDQNNNKANILTASKGEMYMTNNKQFFVMKLYNGHQYQESSSTGSGKDKTYPFTRTSFDEWTKIFDLSEFEMNRTDENLFKSHQTMLSAAQLYIAIDSIDRKIEHRTKVLSKHMHQYFYFSKDTTKYKKQLDNSKYQSKSNPSTKQKNDSIPSINKKTKIVKPDSAALAAKAKALKIRNQASAKKALKQDISKEFKEYESLSETFPAFKLKMLFNKAKSHARSIHGQAETTLRTLDRVNESRVKHIYELNIKFTLAVVCFVFLFIGAPMGAIVRKGGFGYPILVSIIFFVFFIVMNVFCKKLAQTFVVPAIFAAWIPLFVLIPIGITLTYRAMHDMKIANIERYLKIFGVIARFFGKFT